MNIQTEEEAMEDKRMRVLEKLQVDIARIAKENMEEVRKRHPEIKDEEELKKHLIRTEIMDQLDTVMKTSFRNLIRGIETDPDTKISKHVYQNLDYDADAAEKAKEKADAKEAEKQQQAKAQQPSSSMKMPNKTLHEREPSVVAGETNKSVIKNFLNKFDNLIDKKNGNQ